MLLIGRLLIAAALLGTIGTTLRAYPHQLAYFNELAGGPSEGWRHMLGSSFDWGQDLRIAAQYSVQHGVHRYVVRSMCDPEDFLRFASSDGSPSGADSEVVLTKEMLAFSADVRGRGTWKRRGPSSEFERASDYPLTRTLSPTLYLSRTPPVKQERSLQPRHVDQF